MKNSLLTIASILRHTSQILILFLLLATSTCGQKKVAETKQGEVKIEKIAGNLNHPWGMALLPDGRLLLTERSGSVRILENDSTVSDPLEGAPEVLAKGQGGMMDIALDPDFENNKLVYITYAKPGANGLSTTALGRGTFENGRINNFSDIFVQKDMLDSDKHYGNRIVFSEGKIFLVLGERFQFDPAQDLSNHMGTIVRINPDGSIPDDNPFVSDENAESEIWSYGHRNIEAAAIDPATGLLWIAEMGPKGGDELNQPKAGKNYGWPLVSWGNNYDNSKIPDPPTRPEFEDAVIHWTPVISPSGMLFYNGNMFPEWQGHMLIGGLSSKAVIIVRINGSEAEEVDRIEMGSRIRDVEQAADGSVYLLTDENNGEVLRLHKRN